MKTLRQRKKEAWTQIAQAFERELGPDAPAAEMTKAGLCYAISKLDIDGETFQSMHVDLDDVSDAGCEANPGPMLWWWAGPKQDPEGHANRAVLATLLAESA